MSTIQAIRQGKMPHNAQLEEMLNKMIENQVIQSRENKISEDGKILLNDFRELLQTVKKALNVKNKDELFQSMVYHLHCMESPISKGKNKKENYN
jgi:transcriptional regulatory protein LevR